MDNFENYKQELDNIHAPEALIMRTLDKVHEEERRISAENNVHGDDGINNPDNSYTSNVTNISNTRDESNSPVKINFFKKYRKEISILTGVLAAAALLMLVVRTGILDRSGKDMASDSATSYEASDGASMNEEAMYEESAAEEAEAEDSNFYDSSSANSEKSEAMEETADSEIAKNYEEATEAAETYEDTETIDIAEEAAESSDNAAEAEADGMNEANDSGIGGQTLTGGWTISETTEITEELKTLFEGATEGAEEKYSPVLYLGSQVVAGTNHVFLAETDYEGNKFWSIVYIYEDLEGASKLLKTASIDIAASSETAAIQIGSSSGKNLVGGWNVDESFMYDDSLRKVVEAAINNSGDTTYEVAAVLGSQVVAGTNYAVLAKTTSGDEPGWRILYIYRNLKDEGSIFNIANIDLGI
ncbi:MAG: hypothetical protein K6E10_07615 [Eubacterium sp.]|nr:hypothetical protein [Eubacterium sp.]